MNEVIERLEKLYAELKLVNNSELADQLDVSRQHLSNFRMIIGAGVHKKLLEHFEGNSPLDQFK